MQHPKLEIHFMRRYESPEPRKFIKFWNENIGSSGSSGSTNSKLFWLVKEDLKKIREMIKTSSNTADNLGEFKTSNSMLTKHKDGTLSSTYESGRVTKYQKQRAVMTFHLKDNLIHGQVKRQLDNDNSVNCLFQNGKQTGIVTTVIGGESFSLNTSDFKLTGKIVKNDELNWDIEKGNLANSKKNFCFHFKIIVNGLTSDLVITEHRNLDNIIESWCEGMSQLLNTQNILINQNSLSSAKSDAYKGLR